MAAYEAAGSANDPANDPTVIANGNLNITAGGGVSDENGYGLSVHVGETVNVNAKDDVVLRSDDDIELGTVSGANTEITAIGSITGTKDVPNAAGSIVKLNVISPDGEEANIGTKDQALTTRADELTLTGSNVYVSNDGNVVLNDIRASGDAEIATDGNMRRYHKRQPERGRRKQHHRESRYRHYHGQPEPGCRQRHYAGQHHSGQYHRERRQ